MDEIVKMEHVYQYNEMMGQETLHPLVSVIDFSKCPKARHARRMYGFYCVFLKDVKCGDMRYGRHYYDYQEGTLVFIAPGQVVGIEDNGEVFQPKGWALLFHPDLIRGTSLGRSMDEYTFFSYEANEALHLSEQERLVVLECLQNITGELNHAIDKHSRRLIVSNIELLLNYSIRFDERQFITRSEVNKDALSRFERLLNDYFKGDTPQRDGVPSVRWCAEQLHLSANYFGDLIKKETGKSAQEYIQLKVIDEVDQRNRLRTRFPLSPALHPVVQEVRRHVAQRIPDDELTPQRSIIAFRRRQPEPPQRIASPAPTKSPRSQ